MVEKQSKLNELPSKEEDSINHLINKDYPKVLSINQLHKIFINSPKLSKINTILEKLELPVEEGKSIFSKQSLAKLYLFKKIKGIGNFNHLEEYFINNKEEAFKLGFYLEEDKLLFPTKRTFNYFIEDNQELIKFLDKLTLEFIRTANRYKVILTDLNIIKKTINEYQEKKDKENKAFKEAVKLVKRLIYPEIQIDIGHNSKFTTKDLLDILVYVAKEHSFCNGGIKTFKETNKNINIPSRETFFYHLKKLNKKEEIEEMFRKIFDIIFGYAKKNYNLLNRRKLDIAIDIHDVPYYGDKSDSFVIGGKQDRGTNSFFKFITCSIVISGRRFVLDALIIHPLDSLDYLVDKLIKRTKEKINIDKVLLDRGFDRPSVIKVLKKNNVKYLMPKIKSPTVKAYFDKSSGCKARVIKDFKIKDETTNLILVDDEDGIKRAFSTNINIPEQLAHYLFRFYKARWGIETGYRQLEHDFKPRTTSKNYHIRLFYFLFSTCLFNLWVLVNICVSISLYGRLLEKPIITSKLFALVLYSVQIDSGG